MNEQVLEKLKQLRDATKVALESYEKGNQTICIENLHDADYYIYAIYEFWGEELLSFPNTLDHQQRFLDESGEGDNGESDGEDWKDIRGRGMLGEDP